MGRVLVTGATGFVARSLVPSLAQTWTVRAASRRCAELVFAADVERAVAPQLGSGERWGSALEGVDTVIHLAALAHAPAGNDADAERRVRAVNEVGTLALAREAAAAGVRRFVFLSSIKALSERSTGQPLRPDDAPQPEDSYGRAKLAAEQGLRQVAADTGLDLVVVRPPLVYGPAAKGNFAQLVRVVARGVPLPFGALHNRRSLISVWNLSDALRACIDAPLAEGRILHVADERPVSTRELVELIARGLGRSARLVPMPPAALGFALRALRQGAVADRLLGSLEVDISEAQQVLGWTPRLAPEVAIPRAVRDAA